MAFEYIEIEGRRIGPGEPPFTVAHRNANDRLLVAFALSIANDVLLSIVFTIVAAPPAGREAN